jgi:5'-3' exonuclease
MYENKIFLLIDTSFWMYYRFFALRKWYHRQYPDILKQENNKDFNINHNWLEDPIFITKYKKLFMSLILKLCRKFMIQTQNIIFCIDCNHNNIWRLKNNTGYKGTRQESHKKNQFNSWNLFSYIKNNFLQEMQSTYNYKILSHSNCEGDDIIGILAPYLIYNGNGNGNGNCNGNYNGNNKVYILSNDNDYLQICSNKIVLIDPFGKILHPNNYNSEYFLLKKILIGDKSDNIKPCIIDSKLITKNNVDIILQCDKKYTSLLEMLNQIRTHYENDTGNININVGMGITNFIENAILIDFQLIPSNIKNDIYKLFTG